MEKLLVLIVLLFSALTTGGLLVNRIGLGRAIESLMSAAFAANHPAR
jgi:hypothetical protein